jgi:hypothetical protein
MKMPLATPPSDEALIARVSARHSISSDAVQTILLALRSGGGRMAQFSHPDFGGMSQWSPGMTMIGDMFNNSLKTKLDAVCTELMAYVAETPSGHREAGVSYRSMQQGAIWWPANLGTPSSVGAQNNLRYAVFPAARRLAINDNSHIEIYDTGNHTIFGVAQAQSGEQTLTFTSQHGLVRVRDLTRIAD